MNLRRASRSPGRAVAMAVRVCVWLVPLLAAACTSTSSVHAPAGESRAAVPVHVVQSGETLYQIAWRYRIDQRDLARWNGLRDPDVLYVGQRLRLTPARAVASATPPPAAQRPAPAPSRPAAQRPPATPSAGTPAPSLPSQPPPLWLWPTEGAVVMGFGSSTGIATGIGIRGREGQPVRAAAGGQVVYAGSGLVGYGQLVIIKHSDTYLSAYGHNSRLLVTQGQAVARGATIALMGQGPERQPRLHFEIRRDGVPVDPLLYLQPPR